MNLLCPNCQKMLSVSEQYAGQLMKCPLCSNTFTAPALVTAPAAAARGGAAGAPSSANAASTPSAGPPPPAEEVSRLAPPPPASAQETTAPAGDSFAVPPPSAPSQAATEAPSPPPVPSLSAYAHTTTIWISPRVVPWIGPVALGLALVLSLPFFPWLRVLTRESIMEQFSAWGLAFSGHGNGLLVGYLLLLVVAVLCAVAAVVAPRLSIQLPPAVRQIMPWRAGIVGGLTLLAFVFLVLQLAVGFGEETTSAEGWPQAFRTNWLRLAFLVNLVAAVGTALEFWLVLRKSRPLPRIDISW